MCGEQKNPLQKLKHAIGSPPRVRGTELYMHPSIDHRGITPACAGNSISAPGSSAASGDHPRVCGEQRGGGDSAGAPVGSPPRVRGTGSVIAKLHILVGITPACAGNSTAGYTSSRMTWDHPRVCGEQDNGQYIPYPATGSPPRVRGTGLKSNEYCADYRITPACAGNRYTITIYFVSGLDHPRVCGEQTKKSPSFLHSFLSDQENSFSLKYNCSISSQSFCARWTSLQGSSKCFAKVDS